MLNKKDIKILSTVTDIMIMGSDNIVATSIIEEPLFFNSANSDGLQVADASAYCTNRHLNKFNDFDDYWKIIVKKMQKSPSGSINGYGLTIYPKR